MANDKAISEPVAPNNVAICLVGMLQSFGQGLNLATL